MRMIPHLKSWLAISGTSGSRQNFSAFTDSVPSVFWRRASAMSPQCLALVPDAAITF